MQKDVSPCKGCICTQCMKSDYNGALYMCSRKLCTNCEEGEYIVKRSYCDEAVLLEDLDTDDLRL